MQITLEKELRSTAKKDMSGTWSNEGHPLAR
jgi:hypothetical protein